MSEEICIKDHQIDVDEIDALPRSQRNIGRHRCVGCAYEAGYRAGQASMTPRRCEWCNSLLPSSLLWHCHGCGSHSPPSSKSCNNCRRNRTFTAPQGGSR